MTYHQRRRPVAGCLLALVLTVVGSAVSIFLWVQFIKWAVSL